jgi:GMP synthase (glutamine-hydrolysing)
MTGALAGMRVLDLSRLLPGGFCSLLLADFGADVLKVEDTGVYGDVLDGRGIGVDRVMVDEGEAIPEWRAYDFIVVMGAAADVWDDEAYPWIPAEKEAIREAVLAGVPYFGVCFGAQLLASAFGAHNYRGVEAELGINQVFLTAAARRDPVFRGFPPDLDVCKWHSNHFALPTGAIRLARSPRYENQAIRFGRVAYAIQCHLETTRDDLEAWLELFPQTVALFEARHGGGSLPAFLDDYGAFVPRLRETARQLFGRWLENALVLGHLAGTVRALRTGNPRAAEPARELIGRDGEVARIEAALTAARQGGSAVIVVRGEAGAGKTALLDAAVARARGLRVVRTSGADPDGEQPFAGLAELCAPLLDRLEQVPAARAAAVSSALRLGASRGRSTATRSTPASWTFSPRRRRRRRSWLWSTTGTCSTRRRPRRSRSSRGACGSTGSRW